MRGCDFDFILDRLEACRGIEQGADNHPEGDVFIHTTQVLKHALRESNDIDLILAALLHDIGKRIDTLGHEDHALEMLRDYSVSWSIGQPIVRNRFSERTCWLIKHHLRVRYMLDGMMRKRSKILYLLRHPWFTDLCLLARWDKMGRKEGYVPHYDRAKLLAKLMKIEKGENNG